TAAGEIARALVERRLAGCVQVVGPITSTYRWQGAVETAQEWLCLIKSNGTLYEELETAIGELHPYDTPEILALPVSAGSVDYLLWLREALAEGGS
ncbi:MAG: divalent-cation tolerance protein CutA, partial [Candidatus Promineifilaceae bacterium]|nr:divalent-cation tolerance protein CutA [Candidatus Promineifilaceae bacterium]